MFEWGGREIDISGVNAENLTLETFSSFFGRRFRLLKSQKERGLTREQAFQEFITALRNFQDINLLTGGSANVSN